MNRRKKTIMAWPANGRCPVFEDLSRRKGPARGKRLRELALLGLAAERDGFGFTLQGDTLLLTGQDAVLVRLAPATGDAPRVSEPLMDNAAAARTSEFLSQFMDFGNDNEEAPTPARAD